jgi:hypothetical protein
LGILETKSCRQTARVVNDQIAVQTRAAWFKPATWQVQGNGQYVGRKAAL